MRIAVDFDGTVVRQDRPYEDVETPLEFLPGAKEGLQALKAAGHTLLLWSGRASRALLVDPKLDPLAGVGDRRISPGRWEANRPLNQARLQHMLDFIDAELPDVFDAIDNGLGGKPSVDLFIDDRAVRFGYGPGALSWQQMVHLFGEQSDERGLGQQEEHPPGQVHGRGDDPERGAP